MFKPKLDWSDEQNDIKMYKYKIIEIIVDNEPVSPAKNIKANNYDTITVKTVKAFIGPHDTHINFGLYAGNELDLFAFFWKDSQDKLQLRYAKISEEIFEDATESDVKFKYLTKGDAADTRNARLSIHSPDFKFLIEDIGIKDY